MLRCWRKPTESRDHISQWVLRGESRSFCSSRNREVHFAPWHPWIKLFREIGVLFQEIAAGHRFRQGSADRHMPAASSSRCHHFRPVWVGACGRLVGASKLLKLLPSDHGTDQSPSQSAKPHSLMSCEDSQIRQPIDEKLHGKRHKQQPHDAHQDPNSGFPHHHANAAGSRQNPVTHHSGDQDRA
jgi:hypothetical protein